MTLNEAGRIIRAHFPTLRDETDEEAARKFFEGNPQYRIYLDAPSESFRYLLGQIYQN